MLITEAEEKRLTDDEPYVLLVEDDADIRLLLHDVLDEEGIPVRVAPHGGAALELLAREPTPRLVILDLMMPVMNGWQVRNAMLERPEWAHIPVIVLSALGDRDSQHLRVEASLPKPIDLRHLMGLIKLYLRDHGAQPAS